MPLNFITHNGIKYPEHEAIGGASLWIRPLAQHYCKGTNGLDIGYYKEKWMLPGAIGIEPTIDHRYHAMNLPDGEFDYIHSSHCLEHVKENWYNVIDYWLSKIKSGGIMFLYLPHKSQTYWQSISNRKHIHEFSGIEIGDYLNSLGHKVWVSGCDFNHSFVVICENANKESKKPTRIAISDESKIIHTPYHKFDHIKSLELREHKNLYETIVVGSYYDNEQIVEFEKNGEMFNYEIIYDFDSPVSKARITRKEFTI